MPAWLELFAERGGEVVLGRLSPDDLDRTTGLYELTVVAAGRGDLARLFPSVADRCVFDQPQRRLAAVYLHGTRPRDDDPGPSVHLNVLPGTGEVYFMPGLTLSGPCEIVLVEAVPGREFDVFPGGPADSVDTWAHIRTLVRDHTPWEWERVREAEPTDGGAALTGAVTPAVRHAVATLPSGRAVLGIGDAAVTNDPIAGQGANNAAWAASVCLRRVACRGDAPFDTAWMRETADEIWQHRTRHSVTFSNALLSPPPDHVVEILAAGNTRQDVADRVARAIDDVADFASFLYDPAKARTFLDAGPAGQ
jgi:hypothetical protein